MLLPAFAALFAAVNLVLDPEVAVEPLSGEFSYLGFRDTGRISLFEEPSTWNRCVKLEVTGLHTNANGRLHVESAVLVGGDAEKRGFAVKGGGRYRFGFELKGTAKRVVSMIRWWDAKGASKTFFTDVKDIVPQKDWTAYRGKFTAPESAVRAALEIQFWFDEQYGKMVYRVGDYVLADRFSVESDEKGREIWPVRVAVVGKDAPVALDAFRLMGPSETLSRIGNEARVLAAEDGLRFSLRFEKTKGEVAADKADDPNIWKDDHVEILFANETVDAVAYQFCLSAHGARWMRGAPDYAGWQSKTAADGEGWKAEVFIPWKLIGFTHRPASGTLLRFNVARERFLGDWRDPKTPKGTRKSGWQWVESMTWSYVRDGFGEKGQWGALFIDGAAEYFGRKKAALTEPEIAAKAAAVPSADPTADWMLLEQLTDENRMAKLSKQPFTVAQVPYATDPSVPYFPDELSEPQGVFRAASPMGERVAIPLAIANMTEKTEEYRFEICYTHERPTPMVEHARSYRLGGLRNAKGEVLPRSAIAYKQAIRFRDAGSPQHGERFDILAPMNAAQTVTVAPKETALVWLEFDLAGAKGGLYKGMLQVIPLGQNGPKEIPVELTVHPFAIPAEERLGFNGYVCPFSEYTVDLMNRYDGVMAFVTPWFFDVKINPDGSLAEKSLRAPQLPRIRNLAANLKKTGRCRRVMVGYGVVDNFRDFHCKIKNPHIKPYSEEFWRAYREWMRFIDATLAENGIGRSDYTVEVFDEPQPSIGQENFRRAITETKAAVPGVNTLITSGVPRYFAQNADVVDSWTVYAGRSEEFARIRKWAKTAGKESSVYSCGTSMRMEPHRTYRILPWKAFLCGADYVSLYQLVSQHPWEDFRQATYGDVVFDTGTALLPTTRLENLYRGMQDVDLVRYLVKIGTDDDRAFAEKAVNEVVFRYAHDPAKCEALRGEVIGRLERILKESDK